MRQATEKSDVTDIKQQLKNVLPFVYLVLSLIVYVLTPTQYALSVSPDSIINNPFESEKVQDFSFAIAGDFGCDADAKETVANI